MSASITTKVQMEATDDQYQKRIDCINKKETLHPAKWPMGKITERHKGSDGMVRVVTI